MPTEKPATSSDAGVPGSATAPSAIIHKIKVMLRSIEHQLSSPTGKAAHMAVTQVNLSLSLRDVNKLVSSAGNPTRGAYIVITSVMVQKATAAASITTDSELAACADAMASLGGDLTTAAILGPETLGLGSVIPLAFAAFDSYQVGSACFSVDGVVAHALRAK